MIPSGNETAIFRVVAQHFNHCATAGYWGWCNSPFFYGSHYPHLKGSSRPRGSSTQSLKMETIWKFEASVKDIFFSSKDTASHPGSNAHVIDYKLDKCTDTLTLILRRYRTGTVWFYTSTSNKRAARPKLYTKSLTMDLKLMYSRLTPMRISINL